MKSKNRVTSEETFVENPFVNGFVCFALCFADFINKSHVLLMKSAIFMFSDVLSSFIHSSQKLTMTTLSNQQYSFFFANRSLVEIFDHYKLVTIDMFFFRYQYVRTVLYKSNYVLHNFSGDTKNCFLRNIMMNY
jgi:hypothetical protein